MFEINGYPQFGVKITTCTNSETVCDGRDVEPWDDEATQAAIGEADRVICDEFGGVSESDSFFPNWHGGKFARADIKVGLVVADVFIRETDDETGELGAWEWCGADRLPPDVLTTIEAALDAADRAASDELDRWEQRIAKERADFAAENAADE